MLIIIFMTANLNFFESGMLKFRQPKKNTNNCRNLKGLNFLRRLQLGFSHFSVIQTWSSRRGSLLSAGNDTESTYYIFLSLFLLFKRRNNL